MNQYITGTVIKTLREKANLTQNQLAEKLCVSDKAVSKWETGRGFPDITMVEKLSSVLGVSIIELLSGEVLQNQNRAGNLRRGKVYVCPVCGNVICSIGQALVSCCGITLPFVEKETDDVKITEHKINLEKIEDEYFVSVEHPMQKSHYISFLLALGDEKCDVVKLYPEQAAECRFKISGVRKIFAYCNRDGLFEVEKI